ncbi:MAG: phosphoglucosamine mutase [Clostridia bacterium]|nr:phosphoglucosamine mutase [Clostridia bacterium]
MSVFFGTDGLRGKVGQDLNYDIAFKCGNSLALLMGNKGKVVVGRDTRVTGSYLQNAISAGLMAGGVDVYDVGIIPTAGISYITKSCGFDFGIIITASHNPSEYNGIKIISSLGEKITDLQEEEIERGFIKSKIVEYSKIGQCITDKRFASKYFNHIISSATICLCGLKIVVDGSNGASCNIAPKIFKKLGATVYKINCRNKGLDINNKCGSLHPESLIKKVKKLKADFGVAFDGDADRIIVIDSNGKVIDGDMIILALAKYYKDLGLLKNNTVVGTSQTNMGIEQDLKNCGIQLERADVGDKYVIALMNKHSVMLGGEQSGHIIIKRFLPTGDGILTAVQLACACRHKNISISKLCEATIFPQTNINVEVKDKIRILGNEKLAIAISNAKQELAGNGRVLVRASGTEPKIRIMVEGENQRVTNSLAEYLEKLILSLEQEEN